MSEYLDCLLKFLKKTWPFLIAFFVYVLITYLADFNGCVSKLVFGVPCPGCGLSRAFFSLITFNIPLAIYYNPLIFLIPIIAFVLIFHDINWVNKIYQSKIFWIFLLFIIIVVFVIRMVIIYPNPPLDINRDSLLFRFLDLF